MAAGWFRDTSDNKLVAAADSELTPPTGHDFILKSTIEAVYTGEIWQLGTWDGTTYVPPADIIVPYDQTTDSGQVKDGAHAMMDVFDTAIAFIRENRAVWRPAAVEKALTGIHWQIVNSARLALNSTRTHARRQKFLEESASWPDETNGNVVDYVDVFNTTDDELGTPTKDFSWVDPEPDPYHAHAM